MSLTPKSIMNRLEKVYGRPHHVPSGDAVGELVLTVLSCGGGADAGACFRAERAPVDDRLP